MLFGFNNELHPKLIDSLNLTAQPLLAEPAQSHFFFETDTIKMLVSGIQQSLLQDAIEICIIKGEQGIGKSSLAHHLHSGEKKYHSFAIINEKRNHLAQLFKAIISDASFTSDDVQVLAKQAAIEIFHLLRNHQQPVLIIDNAHTLREKTFQAFLRFMLAIKQQGVGVLKLVLVAEKSVEKLIEKAPEDSIHVENIYTALMRPLNPVETAAYLKHRFAQAGCHDMPLNDKALQAVVQYASGIPALVTSKAAQILNATNATPLLQNKRIQLGGYIAAALIFIGLGYFYMQQQNMTHTPALTTAPTDDANNSNAFTISETADNNNADNILPAQSNQTDTATPLTSLPSLPLPEEIVVSNTLAISADGLLKQQATQVEENALQVNNNASNLSENTNVTATTVNSISNSVSAEVITPELTSTDNSRDIDNNILYSHRWLLEQDPNAIVLQLLGTANYNQFLNFSETIITTCQLAYFRTSRNQANWHVLLCGPYASSQAALADIENLPLTIQNNKPWPRRIGTIQTRIRQTL